MPTLASLLLLALAAGADAGAPPRFQSADGPPLSGYDAAWDALQEFYGDATPPTFTVVVKPAPGPSQFNSARARLLLPRDTLRDNGLAILAHEGSHVCLARLTRGASELEALRFIDEGLATLFEHRLAGTLPELERRAEEAAALQLVAKNLSFARLARWSVYFGTPEPRHPYAYPVGAHFDLFLISKFGEARFKAFLVALGRERTLDGAARRALGLGAGELERAWIASLKDVKVEPPAAVSFEPPLGATGVPLGTRELRVTFNTDMASTTCVQTGCGTSNVCYDAARWASPRELVIVPGGPLLPKHRYRIGLGIEGRCLFASLNGQRLEPISWEFATE